jgi:hypothetical protein
MFFIEIRLTGFTKADTIRDFHVAVGAVALAPLAVFMRLRAFGWFFARFACQAVFVVL